MKLGLRYNSNTHLPVTATCLRGADPLKWLQEINHWEMPLDEMDFFILPQSVQSVEASGLFIIFKDHTKAEKINLLEPYINAGQKLFIPASTEVTPQVSLSELDSLLLWDLQVFHPSIGIIGFEKMDNIDLADLFFYNQPSERDWSFAHPGIPDRPILNAIDVIQPTTEELIESVRKEIGQKDLKDIPKKKGDKISTVEKITDKVKWSLFKGTSSIMKFVNRILPESDGLANSSGSEGLLQRFQQWVMKSLGDLEAKRNDEIKRLLNLFDENTNEALQYAIPLNSPYLNRGSQQSSSTLSRNPLKFNLGKLGGGQFVDSWDVGDRYNDLRTKYLRAAEREIENKDFKKAAYVYAHLLGDYNSAANTLEQGNMHREAAVLYKDHLKNTPAAADCLERGGLYLEAIELNKELNKHEKVGDLYKIVDQDNNAELYYEKHIEAKISHNDYLDAGRVVFEKLDQKDRAKGMLLEGWQLSYQVEPCLKKYFDLIEETEEDGAVEKHIKKVFANHTGKHKRVPFLNVLEQVNKKKKDELLALTSREIAYEIVHDEAAQGNIQLLNRLKTFLPDDKLIGSDTSRYANNSNFKPAKPAAKILHLDTAIRWVTAVWHRNQFLAIGIKDNCLQMARGNWYGNIEYYSWTNPVKKFSRFTFINAPYYSNTILLHSTDTIPITRKNLPKNKYFNEPLTVYCPIWLHKGTAQYIINEERAISRIEIANNDMTLHYYTMDGALKNSIHCTFEGYTPQLSQVVSNPLMVSNKGYYYTYQEKDFIIVSEKGVAAAFTFNTVIRFFSGSSSLTDFYVVISTNSGCLLFKPFELNLNSQGSYFAVELIPTAIKFIASDKFVIIEKTTISLFQIIDDNPVHVQRYQTHTKVISAMSTTVRNQFALLEESGKITICDIA